MARIGVEQLKLVRALQQRLVLVLAVDLDQQLAQLAQLRQRRRPAVDPGTRAAVGADDAPQLAAAPPSGPVSSSSFSASQARAAGLSSSENSADSSARSAPWRTIPASARVPVRQSRASTSSDLPAPVSPETTVRRGSSASSTPLTTAKSRKVRWLSMDGGFCLNRRRAGCPACTCRPAALSMTA
jgi:hypothetical protein